LPLFLVAAPVAVNLGGAGALVALVTAGDGDGVGVSISTAVVVSSVNASQVEHSTVL